MLGLRAEGLGRAQGSGLRAVRFRASGFGFGVIVVLYHPHTTEQFGAEGVKHLWGLGRRVTRAFTFGGLGPQGKPESSRLQGFGTLGA